MDCPVLVTDVQDYVGRTLTVDEQARTRALLNDGWEQILARVPGVVARYTSGDLRPGAVVAVLRRAVAAVLDNPEGFIQESIEDWAGRRDPFLGSGRLMLTDEDFAMLRPFTLTGAFEIQLGCD
jgi:hypothetical protein